MDGQEICESGVISQVIAETFGDDKAMLGTPEERIEVLEWIAIAETVITFRVPRLPVLMDQGKSLDELRSQAIKPMQQVFEANVQRFETHFRNRGSEFLLGSGFSVADTMCGWSLFTMHEWGIMDLATGKSPLPLAYLDRLRNRTAFKKALAYGGAEPGVYKKGYIRIDR